MFTQKLNRIIFSAGIISFCFTIFGCATGPQPAYVPPTITINTIPAGADISVQGNYIGVSPVTIPMPMSSDMLEHRRGLAMYGMLRTRTEDEVGRADQPLQIQAQLKGYETKDVTFGFYHAPKDQVIQPIFSDSAVTTTKPGYYTFSNQLTIKLSPK